LLLMEAHGISRAHLLGHSVGGRFAIHLAANHPERVEKLVLAGASGVKPRRKPSYYFKVALAKTGKFAACYLGSAGEALRRRIYDRIASPDYRSAGVLRPTFIRIINHDIRPFLPKIKAKTLLIWGKNDEETPLYAGEEMHARIPGSELVVME